MPSFDSLAKLIKVEIFRDFFQVVSLFSGKLFGGAFSRISEVFSVCFSCWLGAYADAHRVGISLGLFALKFLVVVPLSSAFWWDWRTFGSATAAQGLDVETRHSRGKKAIWLARWGSLALTSLYLPVARDVLLILSCDLSFVGPEDVCWNGTHGFLALLAVITAVVYLVAVPYLFFRIIEASKPTVSLFDDKGRLRAGAHKDLLSYTDEDYRRDLEADANFYRDLYAGLERKYAYYRVVIMTGKAFLVVVASLCLTTNLVGGRVCSGDFNCGTVTDDAKDQARRLLLIQSIVSAVLVAGWAAAAAAAAPYLRDSDDVLESVSRVAMLLTCVLGCISYSTSGQGFATAMLQILVAVGTALMFFMGLSSFPALKKFVKERRGRLDLTPSRFTKRRALVECYSELDFAKERASRIWQSMWDAAFGRDELLRRPHDEQMYPDARKKWEAKHARKDGPAVHPAEGEHARAARREDSAGDVPGLVAGPESDADREDDEWYRPIPMEFAPGTAAPPYLLGDQVSAEERHLENKKILSHEGLDSFESALVAASQLEVRPELLALFQLMGLDVYWDGPVETDPSGRKGTAQERRQAPSKSPSGWGKLSVIPFPLAAVLAMDDTHELAVFSAAPVVNGVARDAGAGRAEIVRLCDLNAQPAVRAKRDVRLALRCLDGQQVAFHYECTKKKSKSRRVMRGGRSEQESYYVNVHFTFERGVLSVASGKSQAARWRDPVSGAMVDVNPGFRVSLSFSDGVGRDSEGKVWSNEQETIGHGELGVLPSFDLTDNLRRLLAGNQAVINERYLSTTALYQRYRQHRWSEFFRRESTLSYSFHYFVYLNDGIGRPELEQLLHECEVNPSVRDLPRRHARALGTAMRQREFFDRSRTCAYWFIFWHDVFVNNRDMGVVRRARDLLDPSRGGDVGGRPGAEGGGGGGGESGGGGDGPICYRPMPRDQLERLLEERGLRPNQGRTFLFGLRSNLFNDQLLDVLYRGMAAVEVANPNAKPGPSDEDPSSLRLLADLGHSSLSDRYRSCQLFRKVGEILPGPSEGQAPLHASGAPSSAPPASVDPNPVAMMQGMRAPPHAPASSEDRRRPPPAAQGWDAPRSREVGEEHEF